MTAMKPMDIPLQFPLKKEQSPIEDDNDSDASLNELNNILSMPLPSISENRFLLPNDHNDEFLRLTTMVRAVYFSYLHKCLLSNYIVCYKQNNKEMPCYELKQCANQMELNALCCSLEASLYRQNMLKLISDIKIHTSQKKMYKKLIIFLETPPNKIDVAVQTNNLWSDDNFHVQKADSTQNTCVSSNSKKLLSFDETFPQIAKRSNFETEDTQLSSTCPNVDEINSDFLTTEDEKVDDHTVFEKETHESIFDDDSQDTASSSQHQTLNNPDYEMLTSENFIQTENDNSQDSLLQHMEDMFCESDDSSDLTTLIEKHSGVTKAIVDKEISQMCLEAPTFSAQNANVEESNTLKRTKGQSSEIRSNSTQGKFSFSYYKEMKKRTLDESDSQVNKETVESKQRKRMNGIWFVERVHQVSKLKAKLTELSLTNYRKHGKIKERFAELFGDSDGEEMMPDSPICIEEHLTACKERIAPWIVKYLMPFYKKRRIKDRQLFKTVAKHIADMLIIENTFPEQNCVSKYIENYFRNKKFIKTSQDIYL